MQPLKSSQTQTDADRRKPHRHRSSNSSLDVIVYHVGMLIRGHRDDHG